MFFWYWITLVVQDKGLLNRLLFLLHLNMLHLHYITEDLCLHCLGGLAAERMCLIGYLHGLGINLPDYQTE